MNTSILGITPSRFNQRQISSLRVRRPFCKHSLQLIGFQPLSAYSPPLVVTLAGNCLERQAKRESDSPLPWQNQYKRRLNAVCRTPSW